MSRLLVTLCTYNERENLARLIPEIHRHAPEADVLVVDDASPDGTGTLADELAAADPRVRVVHRTGKLGLGTATVAAFRYGMAEGYDLLLNMDADFSHPPAQIPVLVALVEGEAGIGGTEDRGSRGIEGHDLASRLPPSPASPLPPSLDSRPADVAIGSRYVPGGEIIGWRPLRHVMSRGVNLLSRNLLGLSPRDTSGAFRCYRIELLRRIDFDKIVAKGYAFEEEILFRCRQVGARFVESPIRFEDRRAGESKINAKEVATALRDIALLGVENLRTPKRERARGRVGEGARGEPRA